MEYRKLISFGKSSFVVSIPKPWVDKHKLKKGDIIHLDEIDNNILLMPKPASLEEDEDKEIVINVDNKSVLQIKREVNSAYTLNYQKIVLKGNKLTTKIKEIQNLIQNLIALEVMEQNPTTIIAKDFLKMDTVSIKELIRKMDLITRTMMGESINTFKEDLYEAVNNRDEDVNRLYLLVRRATLYRLNNQAKSFKSAQSNPIKLVGHIFSSFYLEGIADETRRVARYMRLVKLNKKQKDKFESVFNQVRDFYLETMKNLYTNNVSDALILSNRKKELMNEIDPFYQENSSKQYVPHMVDRLRRMISYIHHLGRLIYQEHNYESILIPK